MSCWRWPILLLLYLICDKEEKDNIFADVYESVKWELNYKNIPFFVCLVYEMKARKSSRNILYYRTKRHKVVSAICRFFWPIAESVEIGASHIGPGLTIPHGNVILFANSIGDNCHVCPGVVVGQINSGMFPIIGNNVLLGANSTVLGNIRIGDNVKIGAACYIRENIEDNSLVFAPSSNIYVKEQKPESF